MSQLGMFGEPLSEARARVLKGRWEPEGIVCPCCDQFAKVYKRKLNGSMARVLIWIWKEQRRLHGVWVHVPTMQTRLAAGGAAPQGDAGKLLYWKLLDEKEPEPGSDAPCSGFYRVTPAGEKFIHGAALQKYVLLYNAAVLGFEGEQLSIEDCLGSRFSYHELMQEVPHAP